MTSPTPERFLRRPLPRAAAAFTAAAGLLLAVAACDHDEPSENANDETVFSEPIERIEIETRNGHLEFIASDSDQVKLSREFQWSNEKPASAEVIDDGVLRIEVAGCTGIGSRACGISYTFELPADIELVASTTAGNIRTVGMNSEQELHTDAGNIDGLGVISSTVDVSTYAGNANMHFVDETDDVSVHSRAGNVEVRFSVPPNDVSARSDAGNVTVVLPEGGTMYDVDAKSNTHSAEVHVVESDEAERKINAQTRAGNVLVDYP
ncbi:hypothetical protein [Natronoglycomyces albus]|uniref:DUF4097 domain-containing protein n=1 Tax=Natronoglycomyces albus TaxID=2811108 RepID=A0A895XII0_9ACTN|nr:hypothetical protein [Natronoglycomyces albus]QSB05611.1 hypothetical protein JQS30_01385 [Natronoglycomyces albus]